MARRYLKANSTRITFPPGARVLGCAAQEGALGCPLALWLFRAEVEG